MHKIAIAAVLVIGLLGAVIAAIYGFMTFGRDSEETNKGRVIPASAPADYYTELPAEETQRPTGMLKLIGPENLPAYIAGESPVSSVLQLTNSTGFPVALKQIKIAGASGITIGHDCPDSLEPLSGCDITVSGASLIPGEKSAIVLAYTDTGIVEAPIRLIAAMNAEISAPPSMPTILPPPSPPSPQPTVSVIPDTTSTAFLEQDRRAQQLKISIDRLSDRLKAGPSFDSKKKPPTPVAPSPEYNSTDPDYLREDTPSETTSFPVDRTQILTMDRMAWGVLDREINSQLPGVVRIVIDEPVYGTDGLHKLLERGDTLLGKYEPLGELGDTRLNICFFRIIRLADGAHVYDSSDECFAYATDAMGRTGLVGDIDNRTFEKYGTAILTASLSAAAQYAANANAAEGADPGLQAAGESLNEQLGDITARVLEEQIDLAPIITVSAGERVGIQFLRDIYIRQSTQTN